MPKTKFILSLIIYLCCSLIFSSCCFASELSDDLSYLLSDKETIDYDDPKLNEILSKYDYTLFKTYKAFIEFDKSDKNKEDIHKAIKSLYEIYPFLRKQNLDNYSENEVSENEVLEAYFERFGSMLLDVDMKELKNYAREIYSNIMMPIWLILKYPDVLHYNYGRFAFGVNAKYSVNDLSKFQEFNDNLLGVVTSYWDYSQGTIRIDYYADISEYLRKISFAPGLILSPKGYYGFEEAESDIKKEDPFKHIELWSYQGIWNRLKYKQIMQCLENAIPELADYYINHYKLKKYAPDARFILEKYVAHLIPGVNSEYNQFNLEVHWYNGFPRVL